MTDNAVAILLRLGNRPYYVRMFDPNDHRIPVDYVDRSGCWTYWFDEPFGRGLVHTSLVVPSNEIITQVAA